MEGWLFIRKGLPEERCNKINKGQIWKSERRSTDSLLTEAKNEVMIGNVCGESLFSGGQPSIQLLAMESS